MKYLKLASILLTLLILQGCAESLNAFMSGEPVKVNETHGVDGKLVYTETTMSAKSFRAKEATAGDVAIANATGECWKAQAIVNKPATPTGDVKDQALLLMATALAKVAQPQVIPCSDMGTNSNDVLIAESNDKTKRSLGRWSVAPKLLGLATGAHVAGKTLDSLASIAINGAANAGNTTTINGDNNKANTTSQDADNGSVISDSGNFEEQTSPYGGIPLGEGSVEPVTFGTEEEAEASQSLAELCTAAGGDSIRPTEEGDDESHIVDGEVCSDGVGGTIGV